MPRFSAVVPCLALVLAVTPAVVSAQQAAPAAAAPAAVAPADAKAFLGDWAVAGESPMGPFLVNVSVKAEGAAVVGEVSSDIQAPTRVTDVTKDQDQLVLRYSFDYEGNAIPAVLTLRPAEGKLNAFFDFADGAFQMEGVGTKKAAQ